MARQWKYNPSIPEYFVEDETTSCVRKSDILRETATTEVGVSSLGCVSPDYLCQFVAALQETNQHHPRYGITNAFQGSNPDPAMQDYPPDLQP